MKSNHSSKQRSCLLLFLLEWRNLYEKQNVIQKFRGGVDNRYKKRTMLTALLLGALFCWGNEVSAYTYSGQNITIATPNEDENDLYIENTSITINGNVSPQKKKTTIENITEKVNVIYFEEHDAYSNHSTRVGPFPTTVSQAEENKINSIIKQYGTNFNKFKNQMKEQLGYDVTCEQDYQDNDIDPIDPEDIIQVIKYKKGKIYYGNQDHSKLGEDEIITHKKETTINLGDANITVTGASSLTGKAGVQTTKAINVNTNSKLNAAGAINGGSIIADASTITGASIKSNQELSATNGGSINAINGNLTANHITVATGATVNATGTITTTGISASNGKIKAGNLTANSLSIWNGSMVDISKGTLTVNSNGESWLDAHSGKIKAKFLKVKNTTGYTNSIGSNTYITGGLTLKGKAQTVSAGATNTDLINKVQMTTALNNAKPKLGKTYSAGTGINLSTNNAVGLTNAAAYTTADKKRISLVGAAKTYVNKVKAGKVSATSKDLINGSQLYAVQQSIAGFAGRIQTNKKQLESLKSSINSKQKELYGIQKNLSTIKKTKLNQDMSNLTTDGEAVIKNQVKKAIQKLQQDMDVSTVSDNKEPQAETTKKAISATKQEAAIMLADLPANSDKPVKAAANISKEDIAVKADLEQTRKDLQNKADLDTMNVAAYTKQLAGGLATGGSAYEAIQEAKKDRLMQAKGNTLTVGANGAETKIDASKKNWTGILVNEKDAGSMANVGYVNQTLSMESSYNKLSLMKKDLEKDTNKGIAKAAAMAALKPIGNDEEDKVSFAIGYGHYKDGNAAAIGTFYRPNQDILIHLDVTAGAGKPSMNTGVSFKVGKGSNYASMTHEELAAENAAMKNQAEKQAKRIQTQKEKIEHLESVMQSIRF